MIKKDYKKPTMRTIELKQRTQILSASQNYGVNSTLRGTSNPEEEVDEGW